MLQRLTALTCAVVLLGGVGTAAYQHGLADAATAPVAAAGDAQRRTRVIDEVFAKVDAGAVEQPDDDELVEGAVNGMLEALGDPYAEYYDAEAFTAFNDLLDGEFSGVGLVLEEKPAGVTVVTVLEGAPAARAGVEVGERIVSVDGKDVRDLPIDVIVDRVKGDAGTEVTLGLAGGSAGRREITLTRERIDVPNIESRLLDDGGGYVKLLQFSSDSGDRVRKAVDDLVDAGARGIVLDLRGNPGGLLPEAVNVASVFIEEGPIVSVREREAAPKTLTARGDARESLPLVVLVDKGSASASEIVAGAVQDAGRGTIVGQPTFGKGTVQTIQELTAGGGLKFTTAEYFTPSGDSIEGVGVRPDEVVEGADAQLSAAQRALRAMLATAPAG
ncbi:MAG: S41 family peptidase [Actinomycetota bacterium]|nr:S41 family peptidase [Actinomycetota bacterium]